MIHETKNQTLSNDWPTYCHTGCKLFPPCLNNFVVLKNSKYSFRYSNIVEIPRAKTTTYGKNSFKYTAAILWNDLPDDFRKIANLNQCKNILLSWNGNECKCNACKQF